MPIFPSPILGLPDSTPSNRRPRTCRHLLPSKGLPAPGGATCLLGNRILCYTFLQRPPKGICKIGLPAITILCTKSLLGVTQRILYRGTDDARPDRDL